MMAGWAGAPLAREPQLLPRACVRRNGDRECCPLGSTKGDPSSFFRLLPGNIQIHQDIHLGPGFSRGRSPSSLIIFIDRSAGAASLPETYGTFTCSAEKLLKNIAK